MGERTASEQPPCKKRQEIPDLQVRDTADQYEAARKLLGAQPPGSGLLLPLMNAAAVAIELYLKCLSAELVRTPVGDASFVVSVTLAQKGHVLTELLDKVAGDLRQDIERAFQTECPDCGGLSFRDALEQCEGAFTASRYPLPIEASPALLGVSRELRGQLANQRAHYNGCGGQDARTGGGF